MAALWVAALLAVLALAGASGSASDVAGDAVESASVLGAVFGPTELLAILTLLALSAFFSASEVAFFSMHRLHLRTMREGDPLDKLVHRLMEHPGSLLTSILMGNSIANVFLSVLMALPVDNFLNNTAQLPPAASYALSVGICTAILVFFGEIFPKVLVVRQSQRFARIAAVPIFVIDRMLAPLRNAIIWFTGTLFKITRFSEVRPAPFMTDEEFYSLLNESEASGVIEKDEREMIQGILELSDVKVRDLLVPRPDMSALKTGTTVAEALALFRDQEYSRIPVYQEDLDHIVGVLNAKDLLPFAVSGDLDKPIDPLLRQVHFVPETMTVANFVKTAQNTRSHLAIVVDEYGGTEGMVTLQDALREVVGELGEDEEETRTVIKELGEGLYRVDGSLSLDELETLTGRPVDDEEHATLAGFFMDQTDKIPEVGDVLVHEGVKYVVEEVQGKRLAAVRVEVMASVTEGGES